MISLVIPAYNEERALPRLLATVTEATRAYAGSVETIVADNSSTDGTAGVAAAWGARVVPVAKRSIAAARNAGAAAARGEILAFVDADMQIHAGTFGAIDSAMASDRLVGGATGVTLERWSLGLAATFAVLLPVVWLTRFDTGVVFCRRRDFETVGGYDETLRLAEDVSFLMRLRQLGRSRGQRLTRLTKAKAIASTRKFDEHGDWHYFRIFPPALFKLALSGRSALRSIESYWYEPNR
ncbi:MAG TPA: glycosyltransferase [Candidatus Polarisedimenticolaceae bacterium]|nr:glycosyltransferase [Candidatus Polarisedimenticolaceae bacterium]